MIVVHMPGGMDAVLTTDPRTPREVAPGIDIPYESHEIVETSAHRFGPHMAALAPYASELTVLHGVAVSTASHETGMTQLVRLKTNVVEHMPSFTEIVGRARDGQPLASVALHADWRHYSPGTFGAPVSPRRPNRDRIRSDSFLDLDALTSDELKILAAVTEREAQRGALAGLPEMAVDSLRSIAALYKAYPSIPKMAPRASTENGDHDQMRRAVWILKNDLARGVFVVSPHYWDSHVENLKLQTMCSTPSFAAIADLFTMLKTTHNEHGILADNTLVVIASELGRFPYLNKRDGKDHFPEISMAFWGAGVARGASLGGTGTRLEALPLSLKTGRVDDGGHKVVLDDVGTTLLRLLGVAPEQFGYHGRTVECLLG